MTCFDWLAAACFVCFLAGMLCEIWCWLLVRWTVESWRTR